MRSHNFWEGEIIFFYARARTEKRAMFLSVLLSIFTLLSAEFASCASSVFGFSDAVNNTSNADLGTALQAIDALGRSHDETAVPALTRVLSRDRRPEVRRASADALGLLRNASSVPALTQALRDRDPQVRQSVIVALEAVGTPAAKQALMNQATSETDFGAKSNLIQVFDRSRDAHSESVLKTLGNDQDSRLQAMAQQALERKAKTKKP